MAGTGPALAAAISKPSGRDLRALWSPATERPRARTDARIAQAVDQTRQARTAYAIIYPEQGPERVCNPEDPLSFSATPGLCHGALAILGRIHEGDHILVMAQPEMARYDPRQGLLMSNKVAVPVELLGQVPGFGILYRVTGGK